MNIIDEQALYSRLNVLGSVVSGGLRFAGRLILKRFARALRRFLIAAVTIGILLALIVGGLSGAQIIAEYSDDRQIYQAICEHVKVPGVEDDKQVSWGLLQSAVLFLGDDSVPADKVEQLAQSLTPKKEYTTILAVDETTGELFAETVVSKVVAYNGIYSYEYEVVRDAETGKLRVVESASSFVPDKSVLQKGLSQFAQRQVTLEEAKLIERFGESVTRGTDVWWAEKPQPGQEVSRPIQGRITDVFGWRLHPLTGRPEFHTGIDIAAETGTPVPSASSGVVVQSGWNSGYGLSVTVRGSDGLEYVYGHLSEILVTLGARIDRNQVVGLVGNTGISTGPHLHFEVRQNGQCIDPAFFVEGGI